MSQPPFDVKPIAHAILSASSSKRWLECPPSARLCMQFPDKGSVYAAKGNVGHGIGEAMILHYLGRMTDGEFQEEMITLRANEHYDEEIRAMAETYFEVAKDAIAEIRAINPDAAIFVERRLDFSQFVPEGFGTGDLVLVADGLVWIIDLKTGRGVSVSAEGNTQMSLYGLGAINECSDLFRVDKVRMTIVQPALGEPDTWETTAEELLAWGESIKPKAQLAWDGKGEFKVGEHCHFCAAKALCRARADHNLKLLDYEYRSKELLTDEEISDIMENAEQLANWVKSIKEHAFEQALQGRKINGWKLVAGRSVRKIPDQIAVAKRLVAAGFREEVLFKRELVGITELEKLTGKKVFTDLLGDLVIKPRGTPTLVPVSDKREEINPSLEGFESIEGEV